MDISRYEAALPFLTQRESQILVSGRVGSHTWQYLEQQTACRVRLFAEERSMAADGRSNSGNVRSLMALYLEKVGPEDLFKSLSELGDVAFIDSRVILAHFDLQISRSDRFYSDLGKPEMIQDPFLRDFTTAALCASFPVILGGHSLMSGGIMGLNEVAWKRYDQK